MSKTLTDPVAIPRALLQDLIDDVSDYAASREFRASETAWRDDILTRARALLATQQPEPRDEVADVQWWLAELDQYGNPKLSDGAHSERAGADKAMYLIKNLGLDNKGKRWAVARVELSELRPSADGVNHDAVSACRTMVDAARAGGSHVE
ncbi:hypothetical protein DF039_12310 [Burkholderia cenocepacia]|nr:hypothetical protein DF039_12310 [Burkholderia cenocepacia]